MNEKEIVTVNNKGFRPFIFSFLDNFKIDERNSPNDNLVTFLAKKFLAIKSWCATIK